MSRRSWNRRPDKRGVSWRSRIALVLVLVLTLAGSTGLTVPGTATVASAAQATAAAQSNGQVTVSVIGKDAKGNDTYFLAPMSVPVSRPTNGWTVVKTAFDEAGVKYDAVTMPYGLQVNGITDPATGKSLAMPKDYSKWWVLYINGRVSDYMIDNLNLKPGDTVTWYFSDGSSAIPAASSVGQESVPMYRLYNPNSGEHFYTASKAERDSVIKAGWNDEGIGWTAPAAGQAVYRLYNKNGGEHHYTLSAAERDSLVRAGWSYEGIGWRSDPQGTVPVYREYNPNQFSCNHNYTPSRDEHNHLVSLGWRNEGIAWYGVR